MIKNPKLSWLRTNIDWPLLSGLFLLSGFGLFLLSSAAIYPGQCLGQMLRLLLGFGLMFLIAQVPPRHFLRLAPFLFYLALLLLCLVLFSGNIGKGARRWLVIGPLRFQPSELMKLALPMMLAAMLAQYTLPPSPKLLLKSTVFMLVPVFLIAKQPDLGTALVVLASGSMVIFLAGIPWRILITGLLLIALCCPIGWHFMHDYQKKRIEMFLSPEKDPLGRGYHIIQSKIAIGSGGVYGKGWKEGTQSHLEFLPERATDFIFAVLGEELGLIGAIIMMLLYLAILARGLYISSQAKDSFSRLLGGSLIVTFGLYAFVNMGMVSGILPVVGLPLPLVSFGGTAVVTLLGSFGILMSIHSHRHFWSQET